MKKKTLFIVIAGILLGTGITGVAGMLLMPSQMLITHECAMGYEETIEAVQKRIREAGWVVSGVTDMNQSLAKQGTEFEPKVTLIKLCKPDYAESVLTTDRYVSVMMPCSFSVWQDDQGKTYLTRMNTGLMGSLFGGNVANVMGGSVARDEEKMLEGLIR